MLNRTAKSVIGIAIIVLLLFLGNHLYRGNQTSEGNHLNDMIFVQQTQVSSFDPVDAFHEAHINLVRQLFQTLVPSDNSTNANSGLAEIWRSEDAGETWFVSLKEGTQFPADPCSKAREVTAADVVYTFERLLKKETASLGAVYFSDLVDFEEYQNGNTNGLEGIQIVDDYSVKFKLLEEDGGFPSRLSLPYTSIVKREAIECPELNPKQNPVGSGAFSLEKYTPDKEILLKSKSKTAPYDTISIHLIVDESEPLRRYKTGTLDVAQLTPGTLNQIEGDLEQSVSIDATTKAHFFLVNLDTIPDPDVRLGISQAFDREEFSKTLGPLGEIAKSVFPPTIYSPENVNSALVYDVSGAKGLVDGKLDKPLRIITFDDLLSRALGDQLKRNLTEIGIDSTLEHATFAVLVERLLADDYDLIQLYWGMLYNDPVHFLEPVKKSAFPPAGNNFNRYTNRQLETDIELLKTSLPEARDSILGQIETVFFQDVPWIMTHFENIVRLKRSEDLSPINSLGIRDYEMMEIKGSE